MAMALSTSRNFFKLKWLWVYVKYVGSDNTHNLFAKSNDWLPYSSYLHEYVAVTVLTDLLTFYWLLCVHSIQVWLYANWLSLFSFHWNHSSFILLPASQLLTSRSSWITKYITVQTSASSTNPCQSLKPEIWHSNLKAQLFIREMFFN